MHTRLGSESTMFQRLNSDQICNFKAWSITYLHLFQGKIMVPIENILNSTRSTDCDLHSSFSWYYSISIKNYRWWINEVYMVKAKWEEKDEWLQIPTEWWKLQEECLYAFIGKDVGKRKWYFSLVEDLEALPNLVTINIWRHLCILSDILQNIRTGPSKIVNLKKL